MPKISVLLPVFNAEDTLFRAASSCLNQTFSDLELIIINDGSSDKTSNTCDQLASEDSRVKIIEFKSNKGVSKAIESGRISANGELMARMDADDFSYPERFMYQVDLFESDPTMTACGTAVRLMGAPSTDPGRGFLNYVDWVNSLNAPHKIASQRFIDSPVANPTSMIRANDLEKVGGFSDPTWAEDYDLWLNFLSRKMRITNIKKVLLDWHDSPKRLTRSSSRYSLNNFSKAKAHYLAKLPNVLSKGIEIAGAGPIGKRLARDLNDQGVKVTRFYELDRKKINQKINEIPVHGYSDLKYKSETLVSAVCRPGAREKIRNVASSSGYIEGENFFCTA